MSQGFVVARKNPFSVEHVTRVPYQFGSGNWELHLKRLEALNFRAAIVGPQGSGKSTLLRDLEVQLESQNLDVFRIFLPQEKSTHRMLVSEAIRRMGDGAIVLLDGIERLSFVAREKFFYRARSAAGFVITVHRPCRLKTWIDSSAQEKVIDHVFAHLPIADHSMIDAAYSEFKNHDGNIRSVFRTLYDRYSYR